MISRSSRFANVKVVGLLVSVVVAAGVYSAGRLAAQAVYNSPSAKSGGGLAPATQAGGAPAAAASGVPAAADKGGADGTAAGNQAAGHVPQLVAAGTATYVRPANQDNKRAVRVKLPAEVAAHLADDYIVQLTNRFPTGGYPFFSAYWKPAADGFDIFVVDPEIGPDSSAGYMNPNTKYLVDWLVVKK